MIDKSKKVSIYDLVEVTGFSKSTVSKALNSKGRISEKTRQIILDKAKELNFVPDYHAQSLANQKSSTIGIIYPDNMGIGFSHPFFSVVLESFKKTMEELGYEILFLNRNMGGKSLSYVEYCQYRNVDGVLVVTFEHDNEQLIELINSDIPTVCTDMNDLDSLTVVSDDYIGGRMATEYLFNLGHQDIYHIAGPLTVGASLNRFLGYESVMKEHGIENYRLKVAQHFSFEEGYRIVRDDIINRTTVPTAIFLSNDDLAIGAIRALEDHGFNVPEDVSVIGFDNDRTYRHFKPSLTTIAQDTEIIGERAAKLLKSAIDNEDVKSIKLDVTLIERNSTKKLKKND